MITGQSTALTTGTTYNLETLFDIEIPSWTNKLRIGYKFGTDGSTQGYIEIGVIGGTYTVTSTESSGRFYTANFTLTNTYDITINKICSITSTSYGENSSPDHYINIISIRAYGDFSF